MKHGMIVEAGSPLVQFEIQRAAHGGTVFEPEVLWINRVPLADAELTEDWEGCRPVFTAPGRRGINGIAGAVCLCMGRFIE